MDKDRREEKRSAHMKAFLSGQPPQTPHNLYSRDESILSFFSFEIEWYASCLGLCLHVAASLSKFTDVYSLQACPYPAATAHSL